MNLAAQELGRLAKGKAKTLTAEERAARAARLALARAKRWPAGTSGQDRESYSDTQDRESYTAQ